MPAPPWASSRCHWPWPSRSPPGLKPEAGIWTAIIAGFLIAALGGSAVQIGGPAGAFIVIVYGIVERYGVANLLIATACAGVLLFLLGLFRLGTLVRYVPVSIVVGFTNGIAALILISQIKDWLGLSIAKMPADMFSQLAHAGDATSTPSTPTPFGLGLACLAGLFVWPLAAAREDPRRPGGAQRARPHRPSTGAVQAASRVPGPIVALVTPHAGVLGLRPAGGDHRHAASAAFPKACRPSHCPTSRWETVKQLVTPTLTIALLGAIESLLCARVADQVSGLPRHDPNQELMAQGIANAGRAVLRRHAGHRHHRAHRDQHARGRHLADRRHRACDHADGGGAAGGAARAACSPLAVLAGILVVRGPGTWANGASSRRPCCGTSAATTGC